MFKVSVKGVATDHGRHLLRVNERGEYELLGGKLEHGDASLAYRVRQEFLEESGVIVEPREVLEPWFYVFGDWAVLIVPMACDVVSVPEKLFDQDGGRLEWVGDKRLDDIRLPESYLASIRRERPSLMRYAGNPGPLYPDELFRVELAVRHPDGEERHAVDEACSLAELLGSLGWPGARFHTVDYSDGSGLQVVFRTNA